jgi:alkylresorcinol/alkylpyrone synthase
VIEQEPRVLSVGKAVPANKITQPYAKEFARRMFSEGGKKNVERLLPVFDHSGIEERYLCVPFEWADENHTFPEKNELYVKAATDLSEEAAREALEKAGVDPKDVGSLVFASTTGTASPTIGHRLIDLLGLSENVRVLPMYGRGCAAGAVGLAQAADMARIHSEGKPALLVAVEVCSYTYQRGDRTKANLISSALFADGAAATVVGAAPQGEASVASGPGVIGTHSTTWPSSEDIMGWDIIDTGMRVRLSRDLAKFLLERLPGTVEAACAKFGIDSRDIKHFVVHPGGPKVLDAVEDALGLERGGLTLSRETLRWYGNMSSATVLFVLDRFMEQEKAEEGDLVLLTAVGPGFSCEHVLLRV